MRALAIAFGLMLVAAPVFAEPNQDTELAMHTVASYEYLYCPELSNFDPAHPEYHPLDCAGIDNSATMEELALSYNYVYVVFMAYNFFCISGVEYCIDGWPTSRPVPPKPPLNYCPEGSLVLGDPWNGGGIQAFGECVCSEYCADVMTFAYFFWNAGPYLDALPVTLFYCPSAYSYPTEPHNYVLACADYNFVEDNVASEHGCTIGGTHWETVPYEDCDPEVTATEPTTWGNIKAMYK
jgi:hypothetical protein